MAMSNISLLPALSRAAGGSGAPDLEVWGGNPRYAIYPAADGKFLAVCLLEAKLWQQFCQAINRPDLIADERQEDRHSSHGLRSQLYREAIAEFCVGRPRDVIADEMTRLGIPVMPVLTPEEAVTHQNVAARSIATTIPHPMQSYITELANPLRWAGLTRPGPRSPAPGLGADAANILAMLGYASTAIEKLRQEGVV
jgi:CoA:oxalate CoA-transferase